MTLVVFTQTPYITGKHAGETPIDDKIATITSSRIHSPNVGSMLAHRRRRWANIEPTLGRRWANFEPTLGECILLVGIDSNSLTEMYGVFNLEYITIIIEIGSEDSRLGEKFSRIDDIAILFFCTLYNLNHSDHLILS